MAIVISTKEDLNGSMNYFPTSKLKISLKFVLIADNSFMEVPQKSSKNVNF